MSPRKRTHDEVEEEEQSPQPNVKHPKTDRAAQAAAESNSDSSYVSAAAAVFSDSEADSDTAYSEVDSESELSTSSEEPSSTSESEEEREEQEGNDNDDPDHSPASHADEERTNVRPGSRPHITKEEADGSLLKRLKHFLPEMREANEQLDREREAGTLDKRNIEHCDEDKPHIEMNLGLGVLEEKKKRRRQQQQQEGGYDNEEEEEEEDMSDEDGEGQVGVMQRLMGEKRPSQREMKIQEVGDG